MTMAPSMIRFGDCELDPAIRTRTAICGLLGQEDEARLWVGRLLALEPTITIVHMRSFYKDTNRRPEFVRAFLEGLRAGLPE